MKHIIFTDKQQATYPVAILIKSTSLDKNQMMKFYIKYLETLGITADKVIAFDLAYVNNKTNATIINEYLKHLLPALKALGVTYVYCADSHYFKVLCKQRKADPHIGYVYPCAIRGYEFIQIAYGLNHSALTYNPEQAHKIDLSLKALALNYNGSAFELGANIIHEEYYPETIQDIKDALETLHQFKLLACDIETFSLALQNAHIGTIAFAPTKHTGTAFCVDYSVNESNPSKGMYKTNPEVKKLLKEFFETYQGKLIFHNGAYDVKILIYELFMKDPKDYVGMLYGLHLMTRHIEDTKIIAYLATNSTSRVSLTLKDLGHSFAGNYAVEEIDDITQLEKEKVLRYNLTDCLTTIYVFEKYYSQMCADNQEKLYRELMLPTLKVIIQMELHGMPLDKAKVKNVEQELQQRKDQYLTEIYQNQYVQKAELDLKHKELDKINKSLKKKQHGLEKVADYRFNPSSSHHLRYLLYEVLELPVIDYTDSGLPSTSSDTLNKLSQSVTDEQTINTLTALTKYSQVEKILSSFIPAFNRAWDKQDYTYLHGSFNIGGTVSGRLSSSKP